MSEEVKSYYKAKDDPHGEFERCRSEFNMVCTQRNPTGKLFWGPMGTPLNRRYCLPTGSHHDNDWIQLVSWKGTIDGEKHIREVQKRQNEKRVAPSPYPPMLRYAADGSLGLTTTKDVQTFKKRAISPRLLAMQKLQAEQKVYASPLDGPPPRSSPSTTSSRGMKTRCATTTPPKAYQSHNWASTYTDFHHVSGGRHSASAMGSSTAPPMHPTMQKLAYNTGRTIRPKLNDLQRKMWPEHAPQARCNDLGLKLQPDQPAYSLNRAMAHTCSTKLSKMSDTHGREVWAATQQGWGM